MTTVQVEVLKIYQAKCSCGWRGNKTEKVSFAEHEVEEHKKDHNLIRFGASD